MFLFLLFGLAFPLAASAYLDPGTGSLIVNLLVGALLGVSYVIRVFWASIKSFFRKLIGKKSKDRDTQDNP